MHDFRERAQRDRMGVTVLHALHDSPVRVHHNDGPERGIQRSAHTVVRRGDYGTQAPGLDGFAVVHVVHVRRVRDFHVGLSVRLENRRVVERMLSRYLYVSLALGTQRRVILRVHFARRFGGIVCV